MNKELNTCVYCFTNYLVYKCDKNVCINKECYNLICMDCSKLENFVEESEESYVVLANDLLYCSVNCVYNTILNDKILSLYGRHSTHKNYDGPIDKLETNERLVRNTQLENIWHYF